MDAVVVSIIITKTILYVNVVVFIILENHDTIVSGREYTKIIINKRYS